jgi:hypothetical protein
MTIQGEEAKFFLLLRAFSKFSVSSVFIRRVDTPGNHG